MLNFELKRTGYRKHCVLTGPMGSIVRIEFSSPRDAALFAQRQADGYKATLWIVNERGGAEGCRNIPPLEGVERRYRCQNLIGLMRSSSAAAMANFEMGLAVSFDSC